MITIWIVIILITLQLIDAIPIQRGHDGKSVNMPEHQKTQRRKMLQNSMKKEIKVDTNPVDNQNAAMGTMFMLSKQGRSHSHNKEIEETRQRIQSMNLRTRTTTTTTLNPLCYVIETTERAPKSFSKALKNQMISSQGWGPQG
jgi:hypothetical protein